MNKEALLPANNHNWMDRWDEDQMEWWDQILDLVEKVGRMPSIGGLRRAWNKEFDPELLPTSNPIRRALIKEMRKRGVDIENTPRIPI